VKVVPGCSGHPPAFRTATSLNGPKVNLPPSQSGRRFTPDHTPAVPAESAAVNRLLEAASLTCHMDLSHAPWNPDWAFVIT
jgi:hypothetical protein